MRFTRTCVVLVVVLFLLPAPAHAFKPGIHEDISEEALRAASTTLSDGRTVTFTDDAIDDVRDANFYTDIGPGFFVGANHFTEELFSASSSRLLNLRQEVIALVTAAEPDGEGAREKLGTAFHTLQDFYAHSNWIERGMLGINSSLGRSVLADPPLTTATCPGNPEVLPTDGGPILTTAYYVGLLGCGSLGTPGKCYHGGPGGCDGIHKDNPGRPFHSAARALAVTASRDYIDSILDDPRIAGSDLAKKCLLGLGSGTLGMVIDDTGSMGEEINQVKAQVAQIANSLAGTDEEPKQYLLVRFGDPDVGPPFETGEVAAFLGQVNALFPAGGGDCPELANSGLLQAVSRSEKDSSLFLFTDASSKDGLLAPAVIATALAKRVKITPVLTGSCSPIDPAFAAIAEQTGGQLFFLSPFELGNVFGLVTPQLRDDFVTLLRALRTLSAGSPVEEVVVPVDATLDRVIFALSSTDSVTMTVLRPDGTAVAPGSPGVSIVTLSGGRLITVETPQPGSWRMVLSGTGAANVAVQGNSPLRFPVFQFVELVNPIHQALAPLPGQPVLGAASIALAVLRGPVSETGFELVGLAGETLQPLDLELGNPHAALDEHVGSVVLPAQPFRVAAVGLDGSGTVFRRLYPAVFRAQPIEVRIQSGSSVDSLPAGVTTTLSFVVANLGPAGTFRVGASEEHGFVSRVSPVLLDLGMDESALVEVDLSVPAGTPEGVVALLGVNVVSVLDATVFNTAVVELPVTDDRPLDCTVTSAVLELWPPNHRLEAIDLATTLELSGADGDAASFVVTSITQDEPVSGTGSGDRSPDGTGVGTGTAHVRVERDGAGNGRVYEIGFTANRGAGGSCSGSFQVTVAKSQAGDPPVDDGQLVDSTAP
ncbi:MAG TPA: hypothetical protein VHQ65_05650 [Thermoanaerobaculia bacterium]|nr:hypothetical protein [Thermoanaerobaculia bacterium]